MSVQSVMTKSHYPVLLIIMTKNIKQIRLCLTQPGRKILAFYKYPIYFLYASFIMKDLKQNKELFSIIESTCAEKINVVRMNTFLSEFIYLFFTFYSKHSSNTCKYLLLTIYVTHFLFGAMHLNIKAS